MKRGIEIKQSAVLKRLKREDQVRTEGIG